MRGWRCVGSDHNVNADQMAVACAAAFGVDRLIFLTDVDGVRDGTGKILEMLTIAEASSLIRQGVATGGMQAKIEAAIAAVQGCQLGNNVPLVRIGPGAKTGIIEQMLGESTIGTRLIS